MKTKGIEELLKVTTGKPIYVQVSNGYFIRVTKAALLKTARNILANEDEVIAEYEIAYHTIRIIFK